MNQKDSPTAVGELYLMIIKNVKIRKGYKTLLKEIMNEYALSKVELANQMNNSMVSFYLRIGKLILERQAKYKWGDAVVEELAFDLKKVTGSLGFSVQNLWYMRQMYSSYKTRPQLLKICCTIPWSHNILILSKVKDYNARLYYLNSVKEMGWSRSVLLNQLKASVYERQIKGKKIHNFRKTLPVHLTEQAEETLKSTYNLDFLGLGKPLLERTLEKEMVEKIKRLILELGYGFCFIGNQHKLGLGRKDYFVDLLFYHRKLRCLVAIDLKIGCFEPEYAGKMNFYLNLLDEKEKLPTENPSLGIILCAEKNNIEVEFALKGIQKPIGVAAYELTRKLPARFKKELPSAKDLQVIIRNGFKKK